MAPDVIADARVVDENTALLYGQFYKLAGPVQVTMSTQLPPKLVTGDYGKDDNPFLSTYSVSDLRGGLGLRTHKEGQDNRFWNSENMNTLTVPITLGPLVTTITAPTTGTIDNIAQLRDTIVFMWANKIYNLNSSGDGFSAQIDTIPGTLKRHTEFFNSRLFYPLSGYSAGSASNTGYSYQGDPAATGTDVATPYAQSFVTWDGKLYALDNTFTLYRSTTGDNAASWSNALSQIPADYLKQEMQGKLVVYDNASGQPVIWAVLSDSVWIYDADSDKWYQSRVNFAHWGLASGQALVAGTFDEHLIVQAGRSTLLQLTMGGQTLVVRDISYGHPDGLGLSGAATYGPCGMAAWNHTLFVRHASVSGSTGSGDQAAILAFNGEGWHAIAVEAFTAYGALLAATHTVSGTLANRLYWTTRASASAYDAKWLDLSTLTDNPIIATGKTYASSGFLELPYFDGGYEAQQKTALKVRIKLIGASANETVTVAYRIDGSTGSYTTLGSAITANTEQTIYFGTDREGLAFKNIQFKLTFARGGTTTNSPKLEYFSMDYLRVPETLRGFVVTLDCSETINGRSPGDQVNDIWTAISTNTLGTFCFRDTRMDPDGSERNYLVKAMRPQGIEYAGYDERGKYTLYLVELNDHASS